MIKKILFFCLFSFSAIAFEMPENLSQGTFVFGKAKTNEKIFFDGKKVPIYQGMFLFALGRYAPKTIDVIVEKDGQKKTHTFDVNQKDWPKDYVTGVPDKTVNPPADVLSRINKENVLIKEARAKRFFDSFPTCFLYPLKKEDIKRISSEFGVERIYNGEPKSYHSGLDLAADEGKPVYATASGKIILAQKDLFYTGGTVLIEHGSGVQSGYSHLSSVDVSEGMSVKQGDLIGHIGMTGRANGPHLHFTLSWENIRINPLSVLVESCPIPNGSFE